MLVGAGLLWVLPIYIANEQGKAKNRNGIAWGLFLGWIGVLALALLPAEGVWRNAQGEVVPSRSYSATRQEP